MKYNLTPEQELAFWEQIALEIMQEVAYDKHPRYWSYEERNNFSKEMVHSLIEKCNLKPELNKLLKINLFKPNYDLVSSFIYKRYYDPPKSSQEKSKHRFAIYLDANSADHFIETRKILISNASSYNQAEQINKYESFFEDNYNKMLLILSKYNDNSTTNFLDKYKILHQFHVRALKKGDFEKAKIEFNLIIKLAVNTKVINPETDEEESFFEILGDSVFFNKESLVKPLFTNYLQASPKMFEDIISFSENHSLTATEIKEFYEKLIIKDAWIFW